MSIQNQNNPIGIFDSGLGGLSILNEIYKRLSNEDIIYLADSQNAPYGEKTPEEIIDFSIHNTEFLLSKGCKLIVVACNTATTNAIDVLRAKFKVPFIGIEPAIKPAAIESKTGQIGILATRGTLSSRLFLHNAKRLSQQTKIIEVEGKGIVEAIESNSIHSLQFDKLLKKQLEPLVSANIDYLVLGCSHYPFIISKLQNIFGAKVKIIDSGFAVAKQTERILIDYQLNNTIATPNETGVKIFTRGTSREALNTVLKQLKLNNHKIY